MTSTKNTTRTARLFTLLLTLMLIGSTAACTEEPVAYFTPPPSTPTPTPVVDDVPEVFERPDIRTIAVPEYPQAANEVSEDGARAFAYYFLEVLNYTAATGDVTHLEKISGPECTYCESIGQNVIDTYSVGKWIEGYDISWHEEPELAKTNGLVYAFTGEVTTPEHYVVGDTSKEPQDGYNIDALLVIYRLGNYWLVEDFGKQDKE